MERNHGELSFHVTQLLTGHGYFYTYLHRIRKVDTPTCPFCEEENDSAEHTLLRYTEWNGERELLISEIGEDLSLTKIIEKICESEEGWQAFCTFADEVMTKKEDDERSRESLLADNED